MQTDTGSDLNVIFPLKPSELGKVYEDAHCLHRISCITSSKAIYYACDRDDLFQETYIRLQKYNERKTINSFDHLLALTSLIAKQIAVDQIRKQSSQFHCGLIDEESQNEHPILQAYAFQKFMDKESGDLEAENHHLRQSCVAIFARKSSNSQSSNEGRLLEVLMHSTGPVFLQNNGRLHQESLARQIGVHQSTVHRALGNLSERLCAFRDSYLSS